MARSGSGPGSVRKKRGVKKFYSRPAGVRRRAGHGSEPTRAVPTEAIEWTHTIRPISLEHIERLGGAERLPPIAVWEVEAGRFRGIDGYHRWRLARHRGEPAVQATIHRFPPGPAGEKAFEIEAVRSNLQHGLPLSREERNRAIVRLWRRWGRDDAQPDGCTLEDLGALFNLTRQRIHQIVVAQQPAAAPVDRQAATDRLASDSLPRPAPTRGRAGTPGRFSAFGRFSAATNRMRNVLGDADLLGRLLEDRRPDALAQLRELRALIDAVLAPDTSTRQA